MIKFNVLYPFKPGMRFDHDYYRDKHMPLLAKCLGETCRSYTIDKGLAGRAPGSEPPFAAACSVYCELAGVNYLVRSASTILAGRRRGMISMDSVVSASFAQQGRAPAA
ncbi:EthD family reductase, partial [Ramlibacter sp.]|uniref:EthD family reductase n=1 Tax=Ramlibacter sp. TaxID=1917967 RepID=UPI0017E4EA63